MQIDNEFLSQVHSDLFPIVKHVTELLPREFEYNETQYSKVLVRELQKSEIFKHYQISSEVNIPYQLNDGFTFGYGRADIVLENRATKQCVILELKACVNAKYVNLQKFRSQIKKYVKHHYTESDKHGLIVIFNPQSERVSVRIELML